MDVLCIVVAAPIDVGPRRGVVGESQGAGLLAQGQPAHLLHRDVDPTLEGRDLGFGPVQERLLGVPAAGVALALARVRCFARQDDAAQSVVEGCGAGNHVDHDGHAEGDGDIGRDGDVEAHARMTLQIAQAAQGGVALATDDDVIVDGDAELVGGGGDLLRHDNVVLRGRGIA
jgi:hypothetical protein